MDSPCLTKRVYIVIIIKDKPYSVNIEENYFFVILKGMGLAIFFIVKWHKI